MTFSKKGIPNNRISVCPDYNNIETSSDGILSKGGYNGADFVPESKQNNKQNINYNRNMNKNRIRLTESQLHRVIKESVNKILKENEYDNSWGVDDNDFNDAIDYLEIATIPDLRNVIRTNKETWVKELAKDILYKRLRERY